MIIILFGEIEFCEVFFDNVCMLCENFVGELNKGWMMVKVLLSFECIFIGVLNFVQNVLGQFESFVWGCGVFDDLVFCDCFV